MRRKLFVALVLNALLALLIGSQLNAQTTLTYGDRVLGEVSAAQPQAFFSFTAEAGDMVTASVIGASSGMTPTLAINAPTGQQLAFNSGQFGAGLADAQITVQLPDAGVYTIQVGAPADGQGSFLLILDGQPETELPLIDSSIEVNLTGDTAQTFAVQGDPDVALPVLIVPLDDQPFTAEIRDSSGMVLAVINGVVAQIELPASDELFTIWVDAPDVTTVQISLRSTAPVIDSVSPQVTEEVNATPLSPNACTVSSGSNINVRSGAGTEFSILGTMRNNTLVEARTSNGWLQITFQGQAGYVFGEIVVLGGNCSNLETVNVETTSDIVPPTATTAPESCQINMNRLGSSFIFRNSTSATTYTTYLYDIGTRTDFQEYSLMVSVSDEWTATVFEITDEFDSYEGTITLSGIPIGYAFEGEFGINESLFFSLENNGLKYSGSISIYDDRASSEYRNELLDDLELFVNAISDCN